MMDGCNQLFLHYVINYRLTLMKDNRILSVYKIKVAPTEEQRARKAVRRVKKKGPPDFLLWAILSAALCFPPLGVAAVCYSCKVWRLLSFETPRPSPPTTCCWKHGVKRPKSSEWCAIFLKFLTYVTVGTDSGYCSAGWYGILVTLDFEIFQNLPNICFYELLIKRGKN